MIGMKRSKILFFQCVLFLILLLIIISYYFVQPNDTKTLLSNNELTLEFDHVEFAKLNPLFTIMDKDGFYLQSDDEFDPISFYNENSKQYYSFNGSGLKSFKFKSKTPINGHYYPDFSVIILPFDSKNEAEKYSKLLQKQLFCNRTIDQCELIKTPYTLITNGHFVFILNTRAEMFRGYIEKYAKVLQDLPM